ncbi:hypothetical protein [Microcoleus vaginatus]|uniref:hypothetical protein n=1 Tax=Microcoleus vaginatus TaxID=119532 RepID=UPI001F60D9C7
MPVPQMPVPQELKFSVVWASCPPLKNLLQILQLFSFQRESSTIKNSTHLILTGTS